MGMAQKSRTLVVIIGIVKLIKAAVLLAAAVGLLALVGPHPGGTARRWLADIGLDPSSGSLHTILGKLDGFTIGTLEALSAGTLIYSLIFFTEGAGLLREKRWAEYLTIIVTFSFIPFELYELVEAASVLKIVTLVVNVAIAGYLIGRLRAERQTSYGTSGA